MSTVIDAVNGLAIPFHVDPVTGRLATADGIEKVRQNIRVVLATRTGERALQRDLGTRLPGLVHEPNDDVLADLVREEAVAALLRWEPRVLGVDAQLLRDQGDDEGEVRLVVQYRHTLEPVVGQTTVPLG